MRQAIRFKLIGIAATTALLAGCAAQEPAPREFSGYLGSYSNMQEIPTGDSSEKTFRYVSPKLTPDNYHAAIVTDVVFYPEPQPTAKVTQQTLDEIEKYATTALRREVAEKVRVVNRPGKGVVTIKVAITAVAAKEAGLAAYQYVPVAFVVTMAARGAEGTPEDAKLVVEGQIIDSASGQVLGKVVRTGTGKKLAKAAGGERVVTLADVKPLIDKWASDFSKNLNQFVRAR